jgi:hypothetical protein
VDNRIDHRLEIHGSTITGQWNSAAFYLGNSVLLRQSFVCGLVLSLDEILSLLRPVSEASRDAFKNASIDASNEGLVFVDTRAANKVSILQWANAKGSLARQFGKLKFFELQLYQRAIQMPGRRKAAALRQARRGRSPEHKTSNMTEAAQSDVEAVSLALRLSDMIKEQRWAEHPAVKPLAAELAARDFM